MGNCGSGLTDEQKKELARSKDIEKQNAAAQREEDKKIKLLLLGAGESGKSTLFKQFKLLYSVDGKNKFSQAEVTQGIKVVYANVISNMRVLLMNCDNHTPAQDTELADEIASLDEGVAIDSVLGEKLKQIWADPGVQDTWKHRNDFQVQDALEYFMGNMDRIMKDDFKPNEQDILHSRVRTSGIVEAEYLIDKTRIAMFDVGGQRNERKKWIHCFDNVTAVIFVAAISEYDQMLYEDQNVNRQDEALQLFGEMCASKWFAQKSMILFLNKRDVFKKKLITSPFKVESGENMRNIDYDGPAATADMIPDETKDPNFKKVYDATTSYLVKKFKAEGQKGQKTGVSDIYAEVTCATDTNQVKTVMDSCKDIILRNNLTQNGFL